jgi:hypothetical protein
VPIKSAVLRGGRVLVFDRKENEVNAMRAVHLVNTTEDVFANGSIAILEGTRFVGQVAFNPMLPGEDQIVPFGQDSSVAISFEELSEEKRTYTQRLELLTKLREDGARVTTGVKEWCCAEKATRYSVRSNSFEQQPRVVYIDHNASNEHGGYEILPPKTGEAPSPVKTAQNFARYRLVLGPQEAGVVIVRERAIFANNLSHDKIAEFVKAPATAKLLEEGSITPRELDAIDALAQSNRLLALLDKFQRKKLQTDDLEGWRDQPAPTHSGLAGFWQYITTGGLAAATKALLGIQRRQAEINTDISNHRDTIATIDADQQRLRDNLRSLEKVSGQKLIDRYLNELERAEDELHSAREKLRTLAQESRDLEARERRVLAECRSEVKDALEKMPPV